MVMAHARSLSPEGPRDDALLRKALADEGARGASTFPTFARAMFPAEIEYWLARANVGHPAPGVKLAPSETRCPNQSLFDCSVFRALLTPDY